MTNDGKEPVVVSSISSTTYVVEMPDEKPESSVTLPQPTPLVAQSPPPPPPQEPPVSATSYGGGGEEPPQSPPPPPSEPPVPPPFRGYGHQRIFGGLFGPIGRFFGRGAHLCWNVVNYSSKSDAHHLRMIWLGEWDALFYTLGIFLGPPIMGIIDDNIIKEHATLLWFAFVTPIYQYIETSEPVAQLKLYSGLDTDRTGEQRSSLMYPIFGAMGAIGIWLLGLMAYKTKLIPFAVSYGFYEWLLITHTIILSSRMVPLFNLLLDKLFEALSGQLRKERGVQHD